MASKPYVPQKPRRHRYGAHGILIAFPVSLTLWAIIIVAVIR